MHSLHSDGLVSWLFLLFILPVSMLASPVSKADNQAGRYAAIAPEAVLVPISSSARKVSRLAEKHASRRGLVKISDTVITRDGLRDKPVLELKLFSDLNITTRRHHVDVRNETNYSWFGRISDDPFGQVILTHIGDLTAAYVAHKGQTYWVFPLADGTHEVLQLDEATFPEGHGDEAGGLVTLTSDAKLRYSVNYGEASVPGAGLKKKRPSQYDVNSGSGKLVEYREAVELPSGDLGVQRPFHYGVNEKSNSFLEDNGSVIDVLVFFTPSAVDVALKDWWSEPYPANFPDLFPDPPTEEELIWLRAQIGIDLANASFVDSGINTQLRVVAWPIKVDYAISFLSGPDTAVSTLASLVNDSDGVLDSVHTARNTHAADIVMMITENILYDKKRHLCGRVADTRKKFLNQYPNLEAFETAQAANAFTVVSIDCVARYTVAHEFGHLLGARHDRFSYNPPPWGNYEQDGYGYTLIRAYDAVRTVMAYPDKCKVARDNYFGGQDYPCPVVGYWSDPANTVFGSPLGILRGYSDPANNKRVLNQNRIPVSQYRWSVCRYMDCP